MAFQQNTNITQAPAQAGNFASANPRHSALVTEGGYVAGAGGLTVGLFAWADTATGQILLNSGSGAPTGFVHREQQAMMQNYLQATSYVIPQGMGVGSLFDGGDFWVKNAGAGAVTVGMKAFANNTNGTVSFAAPAATVSGSTETKWYAFSKAATLELVMITSTAPG